MKKKTHSDRILFCFAKHLFVNNSIFIVSLFITSYCTRLYCPFVLKCVSGASWLGLSFLLAEQKTIFRLFFSVLFWIVSLPSSVQWTNRFVLFRLVHYLKLIYFKQLSRSTNLIETEPFLQFKINIYSNTFKMQTE